MIRDLCKLKAAKELSTYARKLMPENLGEFKNDCKQKKNEQFNGLKERIESLEEASDHHAQYTRRNYLLIQ